MLAIKVTAEGSSAGLILSKKVMTLLRVRKDETFYLTEVPGGRWF